MKFLNLLSKSGQLILFFVFKQLRNLFNFLIFTILCTLSAIILYPVIFVLLIPLLIYHQWVKIFVKISDPKCGSMLTGMDAVLAATHPYEKPLINISPYITSISKIDRAHIVNEINEKIIKPNLFPELKQHIVRRFGYYFWHPVENFDVEDHVKYLNPNCPEKSVTKEELRRMAFEEVAALPFDSRLSPWDVILVPNVIDENNPDVKSGFYIRANHCLMDGYSLINFIQKCACKPWKIPATQVYLQQRNGLKESVEGCFQILKLILSGPFHAANLFCFSNDKSEFVKKAFSPKSKEEAGMKSIKREPRPIDGVRLKTLRNRLKVNMSSLLITLSVEGILRYIKLKCKQEFSKLPNHIYLQIPFPLPGHPDAMTNHWSAIRFSIKVTKDSDAITLLRSIQSQFEYLRGSVIPQVIFLLSKLCGMLPVKYLPKMEHLPVQTILLTSMPGPLEKVDMFGYEGDCFGLAGSAAIGSVFVVGIQYFYGKFRIDVGGVGTIFKSQENLCQVEEYILNAVDELEGPFKK